MVYRAVFMIIRKNGISGWSKRRGRDGGVSGIICYYTVMPDDTSFLYAIPEWIDELSRPANVAVASGSLASRLVRELRTRTVHPDGRRENVSEHSLMLAKVAYALACEAHPHLDRGKVVIYAILHDDVEAYVGDTPTDRITPSGRAEKKLREARGLRQLVHEFSSLLPEYTVYVSLYEGQDDAEARFVRVVDKLMPLLIQLADNGAELRRHWTFEKLTWWTIQTANELYEQYPEYGNLIGIRTELAMYVARTYLLDADRA